MRRALPIAIAVFLVGIASYAISVLERQAPIATNMTTTPLEVADTAPLPTRPFSQRSGRPTDRLGVLDANIAFYRQRGEADPHAWLDWEFVATTYMERARLTGDYADWRHAEDALDASFRAGGAGGPFLTRATFNFTMHRIDRVEADLDSASHGMISRSDANAVIGLRADTLYYAGRYAEARDAYGTALERTGRSVDSLVQLAQLDWHANQFDEASALIDEAIALPSIASVRSAPTRAWVLMTRAMMERDRARWDESIALLDQARALSPDDAHIDELAAEIHEARGDDGEALTEFRSISSSSSSPQSIDGVARILRRQGNAVEAAELIRLAHQSYEGQIALYPEAAWGHAIDHWLRLEPEDVDRMIEIAEGNARARPYGETRVKLAMAYVLASRIEDARRELDAILVTEWNTADLHGVNAIVLEREGHDATAERAAAEAIAPGAMQRLDWLSSPAQ